MANERTNTSDGVIFEVLEVEEVEEVVAPAIYLVG
jgi:hypothetical protein